MEGNRPRHLRMANKIYIVHNYNVTQLTVNNNQIIMIIIRNGMFYKTYSAMHKFILFIN